MIFKLNGVPPLPNKFCLLRGVDSSPNQDLFII